MNLDNKFNRVLSEIEKKAGRSLITAGTLIVSDIQQRLNAHESQGRTYSRGKGRAHTASVPNAFPNSDTGNLARSISFNFDTGNMSLSFGSFGTKLRNSDKNYAYYLEYGSRRGNKAIAPRPFLKPTIEKHKSILKRLLVDSIKGTLS